MSRWTATIMTIMAFASSKRLLETYELMLGSTKGNLRSGSLYIDARTYCGSVFSPRTVPIEPLRRTRVPYRSFSESWLVEITAKAKRL